ncbi:hypothetical protein EBR66_06860 [bacterium]|nr:hypothetical protein [bacterium]
MASKCIEDLKAAVDAVKADYGNDPKWSDVITKAEDAVKAAESADNPNATNEPSPGQKAANQVHDESKETPQSEKSEPPAEQKQEQDSGSEEPMKEAKDMKGAAKIALLMLRKK